MANHTIGKSTELRGRLSGTGDVAIHGTFDGTIATDGGVAVGSEGRITGELSASAFESEGSVEGELVVDGETTLDRTSSTTGSLTTKSLGVERGARLDLQIEMDVSLPDGVDAPA